MDKHLTSEELSALKEGDHVLVSVATWNAFEPRAPWHEVVLTRRMPKQLVLSEVGETREYSRVDIAKARCLGTRENVYAATPERLAAIKLGEKRKKVHYLLNDFDRANTKQMSDEICDKMLALHAELKAAGLTRKDG
jgi:hypothetical protein